MPRPPPTIWASQSCPFPHLSLRLEHEAQQAGAEAWAPSPSQSQALGIPLLPQQRCWCTVPCTWHLAAGLRCLQSQWRGEEAPQNQHPFYSSSIHGSEGSTAASQVHTGFKGTRCVRAWSASPDLGSGHGPRFGDEQPAGQNCPGRPRRIRSQKTRVFPAFPVKRGFAHSWCF